MLGVLLISGEYGTGMIRSSMTVVPRRLPVLVAKLVVFATVVLPLSLATSLVTFWLGQAIRGGRGLATAGLGDPDVLRVIVGSALYVTVAGLMALGIGALLRHTAAGLAAVVTIFFVAPIITAVLPESINGYGTYLPSNAGGALGDDLRVGHPGALDRVRLAGRLHGGRPRGRELAAPQNRRVTENRPHGLVDADGGPAGAQGALVVADVLVMLFVVLVSLPSSVSDTVGDRPVTGGPGIALTALVLASLPLVVRRVWPVPVFAWAFVISVATGWWYPQYLGFGALVVALYTVCSRRSRRVGLICAGLLVALSVVLAFGIDSPWWAPAILLVAVTAAATAIGLYVGTRRAYLDELRDRADRLQRERDQQAALAVAAERARIAREMHDIVAHHLTVMVALSDGAVAASSRSPERRRGDGHRVGHRPAGPRRHPAAPRRPARRPRRRGRPAAAAQARRPRRAARPRVRDAGLPVRYGCTGRRRPIAAGGAANPLPSRAGGADQHDEARGRRRDAIVSLRYATDRYAWTSPTTAVGRLGRPPPGARVAAFTGMRDRVSAFGGEVTTGPTAGHGWRVSATMRLDPAVAP